MAESPPEDEPEEVVDLLEPDVEGMEKYANVVDAFKDSVWGGSYTDPDMGGGAPSKGGARKRAADDDDDDGGGFKKKAAPKKSAPKEKFDRTDMDSEEDYGKKKKPAAGKGKGKKKDGSDEDDADDYDYDDGFIDDDRPKKGKKSPGKKKPADDDDGDDFGGIENNIREGEFKKVTVNDLKEYLKSKGLSTTGKKDELIDRALKHLSK